MFKQKDSFATLFTSSGAHLLELDTANNVAARFFGLMLTRPLAPGHGLLITRCSGVHCAFMRYPIDVVYLDRNGIVTKCVSMLRPWRASSSSIGSDAEGKRFARAAHTLEVAAGTISALKIKIGDRLSHPYWDTAALDRVQAHISSRQSGSAMVEFTVVGPIITLLGLSMLQYGMLFFARNQINYASFMAAREGAVAHADITAVHSTYVRALVPLYGGGRTPAEMAVSLAKASTDLGANATGNINIELLNPTRESFSDWNDPALQAALRTGSKRVIPNAGQTFKSQAIGASSGQTIHDANLIKLRVTHGYEPKVPLVNKLYTVYLKWLDPQTDPFHTKLVGDGRIPVVTNVTLQMQSDAIEPGAPISTPGAGNGGSATNPGDPPVTRDPPPDCTNLNCETPVPPSSPPCNPLTDPMRCAPSECVPNSGMCCIPK